MSVDITTGEAHGKCMEASEHICHEPSGRKCATQPCDAPAGTWWGPLWCPAHDKERLDRIGGRFAAIVASFPEAN